MNGLRIKNPETIAETRLTSSIHQWFIGYKDSVPMYGLFQDSIIGIYELTQSDTANIDKFHAMNMMNRTSTNHELVFDKPKYTGRELVSMFLPPINYEGRPKFYVPEFAPYINYKEEDIKISIKAGKLLTGVLDKESVGQGSEGGIFHNIYLDRGPTEAVDAIYNLQQLVNHFLYYNGATFSLKDVYLSKKARQQLKLETAKIIAASHEITRQLDEGKLIPPVGMSLQDYYEELQMSALDHGDEFIKPIMQEIDTRDNWLFKYIFSGSKGAKSNILSIFTSKGSIGIKGSRIKMNLGGRTSINFQRGSTDPISRGYDPSNFTEGINPITFPFAAMEARYELIEVALSTAMAGTMNRNAVKNLESILVGPHRSSVKQNRLVQPLYGETGIDPRKVQKVKFPTIKINDADFKKQYQTTVQDVDQKWRNSHVQQRLASEFQQLSDDRKMYRDTFLKMESSSRGNFLLKDTLRMPINPTRTLAGVLALGEGKEPLDPVRAIELIDEYCSSIGYLWMNEIKRRAKAPIPRHIENAVTLLRILIRSHLCTANLIRSRASNRQLEIVLDKLSHKISEALIEAGASVGIIAAQSISEPITQYLLDAKHRSGLKKSKTNTIDRFGELLGNKATSDLHNPQMLLMPMPQWAGDKQKVMEIANHIEMLSVGRFVSQTDIFLEEFGKPEYPPLMHERKMIERFTVVNLGDKVPRDLINWCIRFVLNDENLVLKSMKVKTIYTKLMEKYPYLYIVYTPQTKAGDIVMRIYMRNIAFKKGSDISEDTIKTLAKNISNTVIRGVDGIKNTIVKSIAQTVETPEGGLDVKKIYAIETDGANLSGVLENTYLDIYQCNTSSVEEVERIYGIEAGRNKILDELNTTLKDGANYEHSSMYADEMSYMGRLTSIQRSGLVKREIDQVLLRATFGSPVQVFEAAAINSQEDKLYGMSAMMVMGTAPRFGTTYSDVMIDEEEVALLSQSAEAVLDAL